MLLNSGRGVPEPSARATGEDKKDTAVSRNKTNMLTVSANEVDRMLYKTGLASPTVAKREKTD